jgi:hypothetical protein
VVSFTPLSLYTRGKISGTHWIGGWVGPTAVLDDMERWEFLTLPGLAFIYEYTIEKFEGIRIYLAFYVLVTYEVNKAEIILSRITKAFKLYRVLTMENDN